MMKLWRTTYAGNLEKAVRMVNMEGHAEFVIGLYPSRNGKETEVVLRVPSHIYEELEARQWRNTNKPAKAR